MKQRIEKAKLFIELLTGDKNTPVTFQTFDDVESIKDNKKDRRKRPDLTRTIHGSVEESFDALCDLNNEGAGIFITVNETNLKARTAKDITSVRAVFIDKDDGCAPPSDQLPLTPSIRVKTSKGEHVYWLTSSIELNKFSELQKSLISFFGSDKAIHDLPRVLRLPGFFHCKDPQNPLLVEISEYSDSRYTMEQIKTAFPAKSESNSTKTRSKTKIAAEGERNTFLFSQGCRLKSNDCTEDEIFEKLCEINQKKCNPPLDESEVSSIAENCVRYADEDDSDSATNSEALLAIVEQTDGIELFHGDDKTPFISLKLNGNRETFRVLSKATRTWLSHQYYLQFERAAKTNLLSEVIPVLCGKALFEGETKKVFVRVGESGGTIFVDLADEKRQVVQITKDGWSVVNNSGVHFYRPEGMLPLPTPERGGSIELLKSFLNLESTSDWNLVKGFIVSAFKPQGPYIVLNLTGEQGCAKSTSTRIIKSIVDPFKAATSSIPRTERDLLISATRRWLLSYDNASGISADLSDAFCRLSTGGGLSNRELFSDDGEIIFDVQRPVIINGITEIASRPDLLSRSIVISLPIITEGKRRDEETFWQEFKIVQPKILGAIFDAVSAALKHKDQIKIDESPRMKDFLIWVSAASSALGFNQREFTAAYRDNESKSVWIGLDAFSVSGAVRRLAADKKQWRGTASDLLEVLTKFATDEELDSPYYPKTARDLGNALKRIQPNLRKIGIDVTQGESREGGTGRRIIDIKFKGTAKPNSDSVFTHVTSSPTDCDEREHSDEDTKSLKPKRIAFGAKRDFPVSSKNEK